MHYRNLSTTGFVGLLAAAIMLAVFATTASAAQSTLEKVREQGYIKAAFADENPYGFLNDKGELTGISPDVARVVLKEIGVPEMKGVLTKFSALIPGLNARRWSIVAAGMYITPARCKEADFSVPTYTMGSGFLVKKGNPLDLHSYEDVANNPDATLAVMSGAVELGYARKAGIADSQIKQYPDQAAMLAGVRSGRVDAAALTGPSIVRMARHGGPSVQSAQPFHTPDYARGYGGLAFRQGDDDLREAIDAKLKAFLGTPEHLKIIGKFGFTKANVPAPGVTTAELCKGERGAELKDPGAS